MIQLNLLPDVKLEYIKAKRLKRTVVLLSAMVSGSMLGLLILLFVGVMIVQKQHLNHLSSDIDASSRRLQGVADLDKILTVQNQLKTLPQLHDKKPVTTRVFTYVEQITPAKVTIADMTIKFEDQSMVIQGGADSLQTINTFVDTLKFTNYTITGSDDKSAKKAFTQVVLTSFGRSDTAAKYEISLKFDPELFNSKNNIQLVVPKGQVTTRSETEKPSALFEATTPTTTEGQ